MSVWLVGECRHTQVTSTPQPINPSAIAALLHHVSLTCGRMQTYPCEVYHPSINPSGTEPNYTMSLWYVEACRHTQVRCIPLLIAPGATEPYYTMLQSPTTPCKFDMWESADISRSYLHPLPINPRATEPYYTMSVWDVEECRHTQVRSTPSTNWTQCYRALLHHVSLICGRIQMSLDKTFLPQYTCKLTEMLSCNYSE